MEPKGTSSAAWVMLLSIQATDLSRVAGTLPGCFWRLFRGPSSTSGMPK